MIEPFQSRIPSRIPLCTFCVSVSLWLTSASLAQPPKITGLLPAGGPRGEKTTVQIDGKHLSGAKLHFNGSGVSAQSISVSADGEKLTAEVTVDSKAWLRPREIRITTPKGVSNGSRF